MIDSNVKKEVTDAIRGELATGKKWVKAGQTVAAAYAGPEALDAIRADFLDQVIYPALGDDAVRILAAEVPRKGSTEWNSASADRQAEWTAANDAKKTVRGKGSVMYGRVVKYAWPTDATDKGPTAPRDLKTRMNEELAALIKACQKAESAPFDVGMVIGHLESALKYVNK